MKSILLAAALGLSLPAAAAAQTAAPQQRVDTNTFRTTAASSDALEIQASQLALERSQNQRVRAFAQRMIRDHTRTSRMMSGQQNPQPQMMPQHAAMLQQLQGLQGQAFDRAYVDMQVNAHRQAVGLFEGYTRSGDDRQLAQLARRIRPDLQRHLRMATQLQR